MSVQPVQTIATLLSEAKSAHFAFQVSLGKVDIDWATWTARYLLDHGLQTSASEQALSNILSQVDFQYQGTDKQSKWCEYCAQTLAELI